MLDPELNDLRTLPGERIAVGTTMDPEEHDEVADMINLPQARTASLDAYLAAEARDSNLFWRIDCGHHQNLLDEAVELLQTRTQELIEARAEIHDAWDDGYEAAKAAIFSKADNPHFMGGPLGPVDRT